MSHPPRVQQAWARLIEIVLTSSQLMRLGTDQPISWYARFSLQISIAGWQPCYGGAWRRAGLQKITRNFSLNRAVPVKFRG
jgi:hypothetical protein